MEQVLLIDGHNVILRDPVLGGLFRADEDAGRTRFLAMVSRRMAGRVAKAIVVFDGGGTAEGRLERDSPPGVDVVFAGDADAWIRRRLSGSRCPETMTVVTSDAEVARFSLTLGAAVRSSEAFLRAVRKTTPPGSPTGEKPAGETRAGVEYWLERFGGGEQGE